MPKKLHTEKYKNTIKTLNSDIMLLETKNNELVSKLKKLNSEKIFVSSFGNYKEFIRGHSCPR